MAVGTRPGRRDSRDGWQRLVTFCASYRQLYERRHLTDRPWLEELLHFAPDGHLHGQLVPPDHGRRSSVTSDGWCPGQISSRP